jgi:hypothetical protein
VPVRLEVVREQFRKGQLPPVTIPPKWAGSAAGRGLCMTLPHPAPQANALVGSRRIAVATVGQNGHAQEATLHCLKFGQLLARRQIPAGHGGVTLDPPAANGQSAADGN